MAPFACQTHTYQQDIYMARAAKETKSKKSKKKAAPVALPATPAPLI